MTLQTQATVQTQATFAPDGIAAGAQTQKFRQAEPAKTTPAADDDRYDDGLVHGHAWASRTRKE